MISMLSMTSRKRFVPRIPERWWATAAVLFISGALCPALAAAQSDPSSAPSPLRYFLPAQRDAENQFEAEIHSTPTPAKLRAWHDMLASEPHIAGTPGDARQIQRMADA